MPYFDLTTSGGLLKASTRQREDIEQLVEKAEYDLFDYYREIAPDATGTPLMGAYRIQTGLENLVLSGGTPVVYLQYYKEDPTELTTANELQFKNDVVRAIAEIVELRAEEKDRQRGLRVEWRGRRRLEYFRNADAAAHSVPKEALRYVRKYDSRLPI